MIEFNGQLSVQCITYINSQPKQKSLTRKLLLKDLILLVAFTIPVVLLGILVDYLLFLFEIAVIFCVVSLSLLVKKALKTIPTKIVIDKMRIVLDFGNNDMVTVMTADIKKVLDLGEFYYVIPQNTIQQEIVCQKSLLVAGSLEEFEQIFSNVITK